MVKRGDGRLGPTVKKTDVQCITFFFLESLLLFRSALAAYRACCRAPECNTEYELRYSLIGQAAGPVEQQGLVDVLHHFLLIDPGNTFMPSPPFRCGLTRLRRTAPTGQEYQNP